jgi:hypothetical protein
VTCQHSEIRVPIPVLLCFAECNRSQRRQPGWCACLVPSQRADCTGSNPSLLCAPPPASYFGRSVNIRRTLHWSTVAILETQCLHIQRLLLNLYHSCFVFRRSQVHISARLPTVPTECCIWPSCCITINCYHRPKATLLVKFSYFEKIK